MFDTEYHLMFELEHTHWWFVSRRNFISAALRTHGIVPDSKKRIVDIGSGTGGNIPMLRSFGAVIGIEPHPIARRLARTRQIFLRTGRAQKTGLQPRSAHVVCFFDVLYHQGINDEAALTEAYRLLKPGGMLCITDSALPWLGGPHDVAMQARERYILTSFVRKVESAGFRVRKASYLFFLLFPIIAVKRCFDRMFLPHSIRSDVSSMPNILNRLFIAINSVEKTLVTRMSLPWGSSLLVIAQKPLNTPSARTVTSSNL